MKGLEEDGWGQCTKPQRAIQQTYAEPHSVPGPLLGARIGMPRFWEGYGCDSNQVAVRKQGRLE